MYSKILDFVRSDIKEHGTTISFLAKKLGFNSKYLSGILKERQSPSRRLTECIADYYGKALVYYGGEYSLKDMTVKGEGPCPEEKKS